MGVKYPTEHWLVKHSGINRTEARRDGTYGCAFFDRLPAILYLKRQRLDPKRKANRWLRKLMPASIGATAT